MKRLPKKFEEEILESFGIYWRRTKFVKSNMKLSKTYRTGYATFKEGFIYDNTIAAIGLEAIYKQGLFLDRNKRTGMFSIVTIGSIKPIANYTTDFCKCIFLAIKELYG